MVSCCSSENTSTTKRSGGQEPGCGTSWVCMGRFWHLGTTSRAEQSGTCEMPPGDLVAASTLVRQQDMPLGKPVRMGSRLLIPDRGPVPPAATFRCQSALNNIMQTSDNYRFIKK